MKNIYNALMFIALLGSMSCGDEEKVLSFDEQLAVDIAIIDEYLTENNLTAKEHSSGLRYAITDEGDGDVPSLSSDITIRYKVSFLSSGELIEEAVDPVTFPLVNLIEAWKIALPLVKVGGSLTSYAPSGLCYGSRGVPGIPPNSNLIFEIDLIAVN